MTTPSDPSNAASGCSRRRFLGRLGGAFGCLAAVSALPGCTVAEVRPLPGGAFPFSVADLPDLAKVDGFAALDTGDQIILLIRADTDTVVAFNELCPHNGLPMTPGVSLWDGNKLTCQYHESTFSIDGAYQGGAVTPWVGAERGLTMYEVSFDAAAGTGAVTVVGVA